MPNEHIERVRAFLARPGMTKRLLAQAANVHRNTLQDAEKDCWNPHTRTLQALVEAVVRLEKAIG
jgi:DNA-binding XRE family transcriptional regulator